MSTSKGSWPVKKLSLAPAPPLYALAASISTGLAANFAQSSCTVGTPPDLTLPPYHLAAPGLTGSARVVNVGGPPNLLPSPNLEKKYDLLALATKVDMSPSTGFMLGAGAGPFHVLGHNSELMPNIAYGTAAKPESVRNRTHYAKITPSETVSCAALPNTTGFGLMCDLFCSDGMVGPCLHIKAKARVGPYSFTQTIQEALKASFGNQLVSLGGVFLIKSGTAVLHVMPDFPSQPFGSRKAVDDWLRYFDMPFSPEDPDGPLVCLSVLHSGDDRGLALRMEHTHCFTVSGDQVYTEKETKDPASSGVDTAKGGHYHFDLDDTRDEIEYEGWFNVAERLYRVDQPVSS